MNAACEFSADARLRAFFREAVLGPAFTPGRKTALSVYMSAPFTGLLCFYGAFRSCNPFQAVVRLSAGVVLARQVAMFISRELTNASLTEIGEAFGGKNHSTVIHALDKVRDLKEKNGLFITQLDNLMSRIKA